MKRATIWKTALKVADVQDIEVPAGAEMLCARDQYEEVVVWYRCDPDQPKESRRIAIVGTGHNAPTAEQGRYIGTAFLLGGQLVFHVFERVQ